MQYVLRFREGKGIQVAHNKYVVEAEAETDVLDKDFIIEKIYQHKLYQSPFLIIEQGSINLKYQIKPVITDVVITDNCGNIVTRKDCQ
jgi:hypothetical protein